MPDTHTNGRRFARIHTIDQSTGPGVDIRFSYRYPEVSVDTESRTVELNPIGDNTVVQHLGSGDKVLDVRGHCYLSTANKIDKLTKNDKVAVRTDRFRGTAVVKSTTTDPEGGVGGKQPNSMEPHKWRYTYRIELVGAVGGIPDQ